VGGYDWFKLHSKGWLTGSIRQQLTAEERSVWADLLAMANECRTRGVIARAQGIPYSREYLANHFGVSQELLNSTIEKCRADANDPGRSIREGHRIEVLEDGTIVITNWEQYQAVPLRRGREDARSEELRQRRLARLAVDRFPDEAKDVLEGHQYMAERSRKDGSEG